MQRLKFSLRFMLLMPIMVVLAIQVSNFVVEKQRKKRSWRDFVATEFCNPQWVFETQDATSGTVLSRLSQDSNRPTIVEPGVYRIRKDSVRWTFLPSAQAPLTLTVATGYFSMIRTLLAAAVLIPTLLAVKSSFGRSRVSFRFRLGLTSLVLLSAGLLHTVFVPAANTYGVLLGIEGPATLTSKDTGKLIRTLDGGYGATRLGEGIYLIQESVAANEISESRPLQ